MSRNLENINKEIFTRDYIMDHVIPRLKPRSYLDEILETNGFYCEYLDLIVDYIVPFDAEKDMFCSYRISNDHLRTFDIGQVELLLKATANISKIWAVVKMTDILRDFLTDDCIDDSFPMYIITNKYKLYGASSIMNGYVIDYITDILGDPFIILPSSIHECIAIPSGTVTDLNMMLEMVKEINRTEVEERDMLSDNVYICDEGQIRPFK